MKLIRFGEPGREKPGVLLENGKRIDATTSGIGDYDEAFFGGDGLARLSTWLGANAASAPEVSAATRLGPCVARPSKLICIGLNYAKHAKESNMEAPKEPVVFFKATSSIIGPNDTVIIPKNSRKSDWEVELAVVIGKKASYVSQADAMTHVAGYCLHNDYSEREWQLERGGQWVKGKSCDTFAPLGPFMATPDEIQDPHNLKLWLKRNDVMRQNSNTSDLIFNIPILISYLSQFMSLLPGDVISTGTPEGVGHGCKPPEYMADGDVIELGIDGLGTSKQNVVSYR
jgi:2-keto-4-pentenoate hydratase/2-oxohepta-3-ene-1,7-dioic acid hydratase in catechol pathway